MTDMVTIRTMMMVSEVHTYVKTYQIVHFKYIRISTCKLYLSKALKNSSRFKDFYVPVLSENRFGNLILTPPFLSLCPGGLGRQSVLPQWQQIW